MVSKDRMLLQLKDNNDDLYWTIITRDEKIVDLPDDLKQFLLADASAEYDMKTCIRGGITQVLLVRAALGKSEVAEEHEEVMPVKM